MGKARPANNFKCHPLKLTMVRSDKLDNGILARGICVNLLLCVFLSLYIYGCNTSVGYHGLQSQLQSVVCYGYNCQIPVVSKPLNMGDSRDVPLTHFRNFNNSCAVDCFLDLSFYCYGDLLEKKEYQTCDTCPLLYHMSQAFSKWKEQIVPLPAIRQPVWDYLSRKIPSFAVQGSLNPAISDVFTHIGNSEETFCISISRSGMCSQCKNPLQISDCHYCPLLLSPNTLNNANNDFESAIQALILAAHNIKKQLCEVCKVRCSATECNIQVHCPDVCLVEIPVVLPNKSTRNIDNWNDDDVIDLDVEDPSRHKFENTVGGNAPPVVVENINIKFEMNISDVTYVMCGAVQGRHRHFSAAVRYDGSFRRLDGFSVDTPKEWRLNLTSNTYQTNQTDGYFLFVYRRKDSINSDNPPFVPPHVAYKAAAVGKPMFNDHTTSNESVSTSGMHGMTCNHEDRHEKEKVPVKQSPNSRCTNEAYMSGHLFSETTPNHHSQGHNTARKIFSEQENMKPTGSISAKLIQDSYVLLRNRPFIPISFVLSHFSHHRIVKFRLDSMLNFAFEDPNNELILSPLGKKTHISASAVAYLLCHINKTADCSRHKVWEEIENIISMVIAGDISKWSANLQNKVVSYIVQCKSKTYVKSSLLSDFCAIPSSKLNSIIYTFINKANLDMNSHMMRHNNTSCLSLEVVILFLCSRRKYSSEGKELLMALLTAFEHAIVLVKPNRKPLADIQNVMTSRPIRDQTLKKVQILDSTPKCRRKISTYTLTKSADAGQTLGYNKGISQRVKKQRHILKELTEDIHGGGKESFKAALKYELSHCAVSSKGPSDEWDGALSSHDLIEVLDNVSTNSGKSLLEQAAAQKHATLCAEEIIKLVDTHSGYALVSQLRKKFPGQLPSMYGIKKTKKYLYQEYQAVMQPTFIPHGSYTKSGIRIDPSKLMHCLRQLYYYLPSNEWWRIWGDGREIGKRMSCVMSVSCINHEQRLHGVRFHSPKDIWPICIFYGDDHRWNLESNIGVGGGQPGWLNDWVESEQSGTENQTVKDKSVRFFLTGDAPFIDAIEGGPGELSATSKDAFNVYMLCDKLSIGEVHPETGLRSGIDKTFNRPLPNSLLPSIPLSRVVFCLDHATTRIVEKLIKKKLQSIALLSSVKPNFRLGIQDANKALEKFKQNLISRGIKKASRIAINGDGSLKEALTLNKTEAHVVLYDSGSFLKKYPSIIDGVTGTIPKFKIEDKFQHHLGWKSNCVSELQLEGEIWKQLSTAIFLLRNSDPEPILIEGADKLSKNPSDYSWGLTKAQSDQVCHSLDIFHKLYIIRYGTSEITPYMMKLVDIGPMLIKQLPFPLMRFSTEGGEHSHYSQSCFYFQHTQRGGGPKTKEPIQSILFWHYRQLRSRILDYTNSDVKTEQEVRRKFHEWIRREWAATIFTKVWKGQKTRSVIKIMKENNKFCYKHIPWSAQSIERLPQNMIIVGQLPSAIRKLGSREEIKKLMEQHSLRLLKSDASSLPNDRVPIEVIVVTQQSQCDLAKPPNALVTAMQRKWPIVGFNFIDAVISNSVLTPVDVNRFQLNTEALCILPEVANSRLSLQRRNFERPCDLHPFTQAKRNHAKKQSIKKDKSPKENTVYNCRSPYAAYFAKHFSHIPKEARTMKEKHEFIKRKWTDMSEQDKLLWHENFKRAKSS